MLQPPLAARQLQIATKTATRYGGCERGVREGIGVMFGPHGAGPFFDRLPQVQTPSLYVKCATTRT